MYDMRHVTRHRRQRKSPLSEAWVSRTLGTTSRSCNLVVERTVGIRPTSPAWKAGILALNCVRRGVLRRAAAMRLVFKVSNPTALRGILCLPRRTGGEGASRNRIGTQGRSRVSRAESRSRIAFPSALLYNGLRLVQAVGEQPVAQIVLDLVVRADEVRDPVLLDAFVHDLGFVDEAVVGQIFPKTFVGFSI